MWEVIVRLSPIPYTRLDPQGAKEAIAYDLEKYGDVSSVDVRDLAQQSEEQIEIGGRYGDFERKRN